MNEEVLEHLIQLDDTLTKKLHKQSQSHAYEFLSGGNSERAVYFRMRPLLKEVFIDTNSHAYSLLLFLFSFQVL